MFVKYCRLMLENEKEALYPPWFFTWIEDGKFAAFAWPQTPGNFEYLWQDGECNNIHNILFLKIKLICITGLQDII